MRRSGCQCCQGIGDKRRLLAWHTQLACSSFYLLAGNLQETQIGCQHFQMRHCLTASHMMPTNLSCLHTRTPTAMFRCLGPMRTAETAKRKSLLSTTRRMFSSSNDEMKMQSINLRITNFTAIVARLLDPEALQNKLSDTISFSFADDLPQPQSNGLARSTPWSLDAPKFRSPAHEALGHSRCFQVAGVPGSPRAHLALKVQSCLEPTHENCSEP